ncbi:putative transmembrane protein [Rhodopirellula islandica]|uniref:Transmembrane protein n=1 Tax=Rhodopirellula islandica TaxID=595434 RepID=A0A0J1BE48_RHOIS|nr:hypothetical protein [Rhodopirellula islandica]KLU04801.1 putative transmembrane protein [Rhodopirellula islandica]
MVDAASSEGDFRPFAVQCVSCQSRLKVSNPALIGTIVNCPKCNSFVQIDSPDPERIAKAPPAPPPVSTPSAPTPPRETVPQVTLGDESIGSEAMTEAGMSVGDLPSEFLDDATGDSRVSNPLPPRMRGEPGESPELRTSPPRTEAGQPSLGEDEPSRGTAATGETASQSSIGVDPNELYEARRRGTSKSVAVWIVGSLLSVTLMAGLFLWLRQPDSTAGLGATIPDALADPTSDPARENPDNDMAGPGTEVNSQSGVEGNASSPSGAMSGEDELDSPAETALAKGDPAESGGTGSDNEPSTSVPNDLMPRSPLDGPPAVLGRDQPSTGPVAQPSEKESEPDPVMELPPEFAQFQLLLEMPGQAPDAPPMSEAPVLEDVVLDTAANEFVDPMLIATPPEEVDIETALKMRLAISTKGYPLSDLILFIGEATLIPIQLDWVSMDLAGTDLRQPVATNAKGWTTMGQLLGDAVRSAGLKIEVEEDRLDLSLPIEALQAKTKQLTELDDFGDERGSAESLLDRLTSAVELEPRDALHLRCLTTESLRRMRQQETMLNDDVMSRWTAAYVHQPTETLVDDGLPPAWPELVEGKPGSQLDTAIAMSGLLRRTARVNGATCIINWTDAQRRRLSPGQLVMAYVGEPGNEVTAGKMLNRTLDPMGLQIREVDSSHWWVGTSATYDRLPVVVRSEPLGPRRDDVLHRIHESARLVGVGLAIEHDPVSDGFLAVMPRFLYRQLPKIIGPEL